MSLVSTHLRRHRARLTITYSLTVVENLFELLYPFAIGLTVNGLLDDSWSGVAVLVAITLAHIAVGAGRQVSDTRSFNRLYADIASELVESQRRDSVETSSVAARTVLAGDYVEFLEVDVGAARSGRPGQSVAAATVRTDPSSRERRERGRSVDD